MGTKWGGAVEDWVGRAPPTIGEVDNNKKLERDLLIAQIDYFKAQTKLADTLEEAQNAKTLLLGIEADIRGAELDRLRTENSTVVSEIKDDKGNIIGCVTLAELLLKEKEARAAKTIRQELRDGQREKEGSPRPVRPAQRYNKRPQRPTFNPVIKGKESLEVLKAEMGSKSDTK
jgi:hypothetical protein